MLGRILLTGAVAATLSACALLEPLKGDTTRHGYFPSKNLSDQDPYWARFYELERQIAELQASNQRLQQQLAPAEDVSLSAAPAPEVMVEVPPMVDGVLERMRTQADLAIAAIDRAIAALSGADNGAGDGSNVAAQVNIPAIQGNLLRDDEGRIVKQTTYSESRKARYNYSVVYVYPEPKPWNEMWDRLESANEQDKWRGVNGDRTRYFIYVGAYYSQLDAEQRREALFTIVGERPDLRERVQDHALASN
ncbi:MAG: hypothetical protein R3F47_01550 [Gammaproteobacteria bacterium]